MNYADRVKDTSASVGQGAMTLFGAPITGFRSFLSAFPSGAVDVPYAIDDGMGNWEIGIGSFSDSVLTRTQVLSSSSNGGLVDFVAGKKSVICTLPADLVESATNRSIAAASESAGHAVQTAQDKAQTGLDRAATAADRLATAADKLQTGIDAEVASSAKSAAESAALSAEESASSAADASRLTVGTVTTVPAGSSATATITGQPGAQVLDLTLPAGADGAPGPQGPQGDVGDVNPQMPLILAATESARDAAIDAKTSAVTAATDAIASKTAAAASESNAATSAATATTKATQAETSATAAAASASTSTTQASIATTKAEQAATSATAAATAQTAAEQAAATATTGATTATTQAGIATTQATTATAQAGIATTQANNAMAKANLLGSVASTAATGTVTLTSDSAVYQLINPNGAARDVVLPTLTAGDAGRAFSIKNTGTAGNFLTVKNAAGVQVGPALGNGYAMALVWSGSQWEAF